MADIRTNFAAMKTREQEPDYRSLSEVQLKYELIQLEKRILRITGDPLSQHWRKFYRWASNKNAVEKVDELMLDRSYILDLLFEKHCTPSEVARLERINDLLREMTYRTYKRTASLFRTMLASPREDLDDDLNIDGYLLPEFDLPSSILRLEDDDYYGSDFVRMAAILQETEEYKLGMAHAFCYPQPGENYHAGMTDKELSCDNMLDDDIDNWAEAWLNHDRLSHIKFCHAVHALVTHLNYSIPDVLRINNFKIEVKLTLQQYSDQDRNRLWWWSRCDYPRFKEVLMHEAASREKGIPLEDFLLQRCRDYFEEYADEAFSEVGIQDINCYLKDVFKRLRHE